ncbi:MAG: gluconate 2-dehydrogenase subunit 3 family protein [Solirubrobacteraceae bacterium]
MAAPEQREPPLPEPEQRDLHRPDHLPNLRPGRQPRHPSWLPRQRQGTTPQMIGRYPDYDVMANAENWDDATRKVVTGRLRAPGPLRFFTTAEEPALRAFCDVTTGQDVEPRVPVAEMVDDKLASGKLDGYRYANMPRDPETWRLVLRGLDETAASRYGAPSFAAADLEAQEAIVAGLADGSLAGGAWDELDVKRAFSVCMRAVLAAFYSHPWAWNEIGYGGPAYPQGYMRLGPTSILEPHERPGATSEDPVRIADELGP